MANGRAALAAYLGVIRTEDARVESMRGLVVVLLPFLAISVPPVSGGAPAARLRISVFEFYSTHTGVSIDLGFGGVARLSAVGPKAEEHRKILPEEKAALVRLIQDVGFFALDSEYGVCYVEGTMREISVQLDGKKKRVGLCSLSTEDVPTPKRAGAAKARRVWNATRMLFPDHYPEQSRHEADALVPSVQQ